MNRKVKAIVNAAVAMGFGEASDYHGNSISEVLAEFAAIANSAAKLPAAAAADAGKVPVVQAAGGYALAEIESGNGLVCNQTFSSNKYTIQATAGTIRNALNAGKPVHVKQGDANLSTVVAYVYDSERAATTFYVQIPVSGVVIYTATSNTAYPTRTAN